MEDLAQKIKEDKWSRTFDPDLPPDNEHNREVSSNLGVRFVPGRGYVDDDGCIIYDEYGQPL